MLKHESSLRAERWERKELKKGILEARRWRGSAARKPQEDRHFFPSDGAPTSFPRSSPNTATTQPLIQPPSHSLRSCHACSRLHGLARLHLECWLSNYLLLNSDFPSQTQLTNHLLWETLQIPPLKERKCSSLVIRDIRHTGVFIPSNFPPEWKYL